MLGAMSDNTRLHWLIPQRLLGLPQYLLAREIAQQEFDADDLVHREAVERDDTALPPRILAESWLPPPGAAARSTIVIPGRRIRSVR